MEFRLKEIAERIKGMRQILDISIEDMADACDVDIDTYKKIEAGEADFSFTFLYKCAARFDIDITEILTGETSKLSGCSLIRAGEGFPIKRREGFEYQNMAYLFKHRLAEPFVVTAPYRDEEQERPVALSSHESQEMDFILEGELKFVYNGQMHTLNKGDCVYYDARRPHGMIAVGGKQCVFLAVVIKDEEKE